VSGVRQERYWTEELVERASPEQLGKLFKRDLDRARAELSRVAAKHGEGLRPGVVRLYVRFEAETEFLTVSIPVGPPPAPEGEKT
jgi:hypothetical protein